MFTKCSLSNMMKAPRLRLTVYNNIYENLLMNTAQNHPDYQNTKKAFSTILELNMSLN